MRIPEEQLSPGLLHILFMFPSGVLSCLCFDWFLMRGISASVMQLVVVIIEEILRRDVGNLARTNWRKRRGLFDTGIVKNKKGKWK